MKQLILILVASLFGSSLQIAKANPLADEQILQIQQRWAEIKYSLPEQQHENAYEELAELANKASAQYPESAELQIWQGIVLSTYAGAKGGLSALKLVDQARGHLEHALELDADALNGSAYTSLGALYYQVPGWPLSFGSDKKAKSLLTKALKLNPDGIDSNFFYADFLISQDQFKQAKQVLQHALDAPLRPHRELADQGRRDEIQTLLAKLKKQGA